MQPIRADTLHAMTAAQAVILIGGFLVLLSGMIALMIRVIKREKQSMQRPQEEWIARGSIPEEKPNFYSGAGGEGGAY